MKNIFHQVLTRTPKKSLFNLSHEKKLTAKMGELIPILVQEVLPGDVFKISTESMIRLAPMIAPLMHKVDVDFHFFEVPNRLLFSEKDWWERFITNKEELTLPNTTLPYQVFQIGTLHDYMGLPTHLTSGVINFQTLPYRAYNLIYNEYYRDQNLEEELDITTVAHNCHIRAWEKDYFTSAQLDPMLGGDVELPMNLSPNYKATAEEIPNGIVGLPGNVVADSNGDLTVNGTYIGIDNLTSMEGTIDVDDIRLATRLQRWFERQNRIGKRFKEYLAGNWGVQTSDARLDRPEFIGGGTSSIIVSEVQNKTATDGEEPLGTLAGHGINVGQTNEAFTKVEEHGYIMGIMSIKPRTAYFQGTPKHFMRQDCFDFADPEFAQLGEQPIEYREIYETGANDPIGEQIFGYTPRYAEYKYAPNTIHGDFRDSLIHWTLAREFDTKPPLNANFVKCVPDEDRIFAVGSESHRFWISLYHKILAQRPLPFHNVPTL